LIHTCEVVCRLPVQLLSHHNKGR